MRRKFITALLILATLTITACGEKEPEKSTEPSVSVSAEQKKESSEEKEESSVETSKTDLSGYSEVPITPPSLPEVTEPSIEESAEEVPVFTEPVLSKVEADQVIDDAQYFDPSTCRNKTLVEIEKQIYTASGTFWGEIKEDGTRIEISPYSGPSKYEDLFFFIADLATEESIGNLTFGQYFGQGYYTTWDCAEGDNQKISDYVDKLIAYKQKLLKFFETYGPKGDNTWEDRHFPGWND